MAKMTIKEKYIRWYKTQKITYDKSKSYDELIDLLLEQAFRAGYKEGKRVSRLSRGG